MNQIPEDFLHYLWKYKLFNKENLTTTKGEKIEIIENGWQNQHAGPDFFNAKIKIEDTIWVGNVEIHINSSDWFNHQHHHDKAYDNVILQVVLHDNKSVFRTNNTPIPTLELQFNENLYNNYRKLLRNESWIPCENELPYIDHFTIRFWLDKLTIERLNEKYEAIETALKKNKHHWETTFYEKMARNFGFKVNAEPFELLAKSLPLEYIAKHKDNLFQIEALFFGQAGFLSGNLSHDEYYQNLCKEYDYLQKKFKLTPIDKHLWKFSKLRPSNFPTVRIAQFAAIIHRSKKLFSKILETNELKSLEQLLHGETTEFWKYHYHFQTRSGKKRTKKLGKSAIHILIINTIIPFLFIYGEYKNKPGQKEKALDLLSKLPAEKNNIIRNWNKLNIQAENAYQTQALLQLKNNYCNNKRCLDCQIGNKIINLSSV